MIQIHKILLEFQFLPFPSPKKTFIDVLNNISPTLESGIDVGQGITLGPGKFVKKK